MCRGKIDDHFLNAVLSFAFGIGPLTIAQLAWLPIPTLVFASGVEVLLKFNTRNFDEISISKNPAHARIDFEGLEIEAEGFERATILRVQKLLDRAEYKRRQAPPGVKITPRAFGRDRRYPLTNGFTNLLK